MSLNYVNLYPTQRGWHDSELVTRFGGRVEPDSDFGSYAFNLYLASELGNEGLEAEKVNGVTCKDPMLARTMLGCLFDFDQAILDQFHRAYGLKNLGMAEAVTVPGKAVEAAGRHVIEEIAKKHEADDCEALIDLIDTAGGLILSEIELHYRHEQGQFFARALDV